jgi:hypothetical protein
MVRLAKLGDGAPQYLARFSGIFSLCRADLHPAMMQT